MQTKNAEIELSKHSASHEAQSTHASAPTGACAAPKDGASITDMPTETASPHTSNVDAMLACAKAIPSSLDPVYTHGVAACTQEVHISAAPAVAHQSQAFRSSMETSTSAAPTALRASSDMQLASTPQRLSKEAASLWLAPGCPVSQPLQEDETAAGMHRSETTSEHARQRKHTPVVRKNSVFSAAHIAPNVSSATRWWCRPARMWCR